MEYKKLGEINNYVGKNINPLNASEEVFEMYSVPSFDKKYPEIIKGDDIGSSKQLVKKDDILLCKINPRINRVWIVSQFTDNRAIASSEWIVIRNKDMCARYLMWYFRSDYFRTLMISNVTGMGGSLMRAQPKQVQKYLVPVINYDSQIKIAKILDKAQELIDKRKEQIKLLDELVKSRFIEMFGNPLTNAKGFKKVKIKELIEPKIEKSKKVFDCEDIISYIDISCIDNASNKIIAYNKYNFSEAPSRAQQCINVGDILISNVRPNLKNIAMVQDELENMVTTSGVTILRCKNVNKYFLFQYVLTDYFTDEMVSVTSGANYPAIKSSDIYNHEMINPPIELQNQFAGFVKQVDKLKFEMENSLRELEDNFNSLMQKAFKGELFI